MLKMYQAQSESGSTPEFWDGNWEQNELAQVLADTRSIFKRCLYPSIVADAIACD